MPYVLVVPVGGFPLKAVWLLRNASKKLFLLISEFIGFIVMAVRKNINFGNITDVCQKNKKLSIEDNISSKESLL
jgi:hypothetical protein